ncbi:TPA: dihydrolipoyl dehydrogenase [Photobacterium damselae]|uniref:dihydrolipoyl dehydrogenase n=1 Tax=Photobacterium damselae TaxID=38293 RepID=UPI00083A12AE|nr:dihydrolipoyl dehydrogenase [Photobacterium damselae]ARR50379.1 dihydrolipoyl dehydrogenase [Photobacterium damselae subsp. damselae]KAB1519092.1 dihydrolipoyl dehydrogenase [Photobacterium damselae subsp. damselae]MCG9779212.1 dihydrolipoyl dehydrogenase [Photobacterium damselae]ODA20970.1 dihydrolipoyl dehydrogenase [Photobacterium damselae subsp. damselae]PSB88439.1 dihydrolipoyl dehydrogenase [Photobacterium damselae subsp. damselae]
MKTLNVDVAVIGGGTAGLGSYRAAKAYTDSVVMIEGGPYGTTCARVGCMPSKLLIAAAESVHQIEKAPGFGVHPQGEIVINGREVMDRVKRERDRFVGFVLEGVDEIPAEDKISGYAKFIDNNTLMVDDHTKIIAKRIVIATGSRPAYPAVWNELGDRLVINDDVFEWDDLPNSVAVFGPGVIGLELGQSLKRLGVEVVMFGLGGQVGPLTDPEVMAYANKTFNEEFYLDPDVKVESMVRNGDAVEIKYLGKDGQLKEITVDYVLAATGRRPNVDKLAIENTSLELDDRGVPKADYYTMQTSVDTIFIAGDASNQIPLLHEAADQARIAGDNAGRFPDIRAGLRRSKLSAVFSDPQIAMVGETYKEITTRLGTCGCFATGDVSFENQGRSRVMLRNKGMLHVYGEQGTGRFLGAEMIGPDAEHLAHLLAWAHQNQMTISQMLDMPFYHPVIEEGLRTALRDLNAKLNLGPEMIKHCLDCGPGC